MSLFKSDEHGANHSTTGERGYGSLMSLWDFPG